MVWPNHLGKIINAERTVNLAAGCGSNQRIFRTTYDYVMRQTAENLENTFAVIQVTDPTRYEFYLDNNDNSYLNHQESWVRCKAGLILNPSVEYDRAAWESYNDKRCSTYTDIEGFYNILQFCSAMTHLFTTYNIKHVFWAQWNWPAYPPIPFELRQSISKHAVWIDNAYMWKYETVQNDAHPSIVGHKQIAQLLYDHIRAKGLL